MADSASESDTDAAGSSSALPPANSSAASKAGIVISASKLEELSNRLASLQQENKVLKIELETYKLKCKALQEENRDLRKASVTINGRVYCVAVVSISSRQEAWVRIPFAPEHLRFMIFLKYTWRLHAHEKRGRGENMKLDNNKDNSS
eukprot:g46573.t1